MSLSKALIGFPCMVLVKFPRKLTQKLLTGVLNITDKVQQFTDHMSRVVRKGITVYVKTKEQISCAVTAQLISAFVFATRIVEFFFFLNPKSQASSLFLSLHRPVCVGHRLKIPNTSFLASWLIYFLTFKFLGIKGLT